MYKADLLLKQKDEEHHNKIYFLLKFSYKAAEPLVKVNFANSKLNTIKNKIESGDSRPFFSRDSDLTSTNVRPSVRPCVRTQVSLG